MNRDAQDNLLLLMGAAVLAVGLSDVHLRYVKPAMQPLLVLSGVVLLAFGLRGLLRILREVTASTGDDAHATPEPGSDSGSEEVHGLHEHGATATAWLLALPVLVLCLVSPPALGAFAAARSDTTLPEPATGYGALAPARDGAVDLTLTEYYSRVLYEPESLSDARVRMTGFVTPMDGRWFVTRIALACCAADGRPVKVLATGPAADPPPTADTWVEVVGRYGTPETLPDAEVSVATLVVEQVRIVDEPRIPYE